MVRAKELCYSKTANRESVFAQAVFLASGKDPVEPGVRSNNGSSSVSGSSSGETAKAAALPPPPPPSRRSAPGLPLIPPLPPPIKEPVSTYAPVPGLEGDSEEEEAKEGDVASGGGGGDVSLRADDVIVNQDDVSMMELLGGMGHASYGAFLQQVRDESTAATIRNFLLELRFRLGSLVTCLFTFLFMHAREMNCCSIFFLGLHCMRVFVFKCAPVHARYCANHRSLSFVLRAISLRPHFYLLSH